MDITHFIDTLRKNIGIFDLGSLVMQSTELVQQILTLGRPSYSKAGYRTRLDPPLPTPQQKKAVTGTMPCRWPLYQAPVERLSTSSTSIVFQISIPH